MRSKATTLLVLFVLASPALSGVPHSHGSSSDHHGKGREREEDGAFSPRDKAHGKDPHHHDNAFDHEAILGSAKEAETFDELPPAEAKKRLRKLLEVMDRNKDETIDKAELQMWILRSFKTLAKEESEERMDEADSDEDGRVSWDEYRKEEFDIDADEEKAIMNGEEGDEDAAEDYAMMQEDKMLFAAADRNGDGLLDKEEFLSFSHPEEDPDMHDIVVKQVLKQKDANGDGAIDFQEYVGERGRDQSKEWVVGEKERFDNDLDKDKDGRLGTAEILAWMIPSNEEMAKDEVDHLFAGADDDVDSKLTFAEVIDHHDLFVGSEATDYGEMLHNVHKLEDEL